MAKSLAALRLSVEEYLEREARAEERHEYVDGVTYAMTGGTLRHSHLALNIAMALRALPASSCRVFVSDVKVRVAQDVFYYPDVVVACGVIDDAAVFLDAPCLVVEVMSSSSQRTDRREKLSAYTAMPSLRAYLIVDQRRQWIEAHVRDAEGAWQRAEYTGADQITLPCPVGVLSLHDVYAGVVLPSVHEPDPPTYEY